MAGNDCCIKRSAIILGAFMLFFALWYFNIAVRPFEDSIGSSRTLHYTLNYLLAGLIPTGALFLLHARRDIASSMGLSHGFGTGLLFAVTATLPMIAGYAVIGEFDRELSADEAFTWIFIAGMFEELVYRGFVFGQLFRYARWGFLPAALLAALAFGSLHLYQGHDPVSALTAFGVTALGSIFFSWLYVEWNYNLLENFTGAHKHMIDLAASTIPSSYLLPELLAAFGKTHPDVYFHSIQSDSSESISRVLDGTVDLALVGQNTRDESCVFIPFCHDELVIATPVTDHYLALKDRETPAIFHDFLKDSIILREKGSGTKKEMDLFLERTGITTGNLNVIARMNDLESIKKSIVNGLGISILSSRSVNDLQRTKQILVFPLEEAAHKRSFYIVYSKNRILKPHVKQFVQFVRDYYM